MDGEKEIKKSMLLACLDDDGSITSKLLAVQSKYIFSVIFTLSSWLGFMAYQPL